MNAKHVSAYDLLSSNEQNFYQLLFNEFTKFSDTIDISRVDKRVDIEKVLGAVLNDNPQFFYFNSSAIGTVSSSFKSYIKLSMLARKQQAMKMQNDVIRLASSIKNDAVRKSTRPYEQLLYVYETLQKTIVYDKVELQAMSSGRSTHPNSHNAYGALIEHNAVCDGFSAAFQLIVQEMGYSCMRVSGTSDHSAFGTVGHSWNIIEISRKHYHIDLTWDANQYSDFKHLSYNWFLLDDDHILADHSWDLNSTPAATDFSLSYHRKNGLLVDSEKEVEDVFARCLRNNTAVIQIRCSDKMWTNKPIETFLTQSLLSMATKLRQRASFNYSWCDRTRCFVAWFN